MNHILLGPEEGLKADWLNEEKKRVLAEHPDAEVHLIFVGDDKGEDLDSILSQPSLFSSFRFVIIKQYENRTGKDTFDKALISFLASGITDAEFVILSTEKSKSRINAKIANDKNVDIQFFWEMFDSQKRDWIVKEFAKEGFHIGKEAVDEILFSIDNNTQEMKNLVSSLTLYFHAAEKDKREILPEDIERYSLQTRGEDGNTLFQAIAVSLISTDSQAAVRAFSVLVMKFRQLESFEILKGRGISEKESFDNADALFPYPVFYSTKGIRGRDQAVFRKASQNYPLQDTKRVIKYLGAMDAQIKNSSTEWLRLVFSSLIADIIIRKGRSTRIDISSSPLEQSL